MFISVQDAMTSNPEDVYLKPLVLSWVLSWEKLYSSFTKTYKKFHVPPCCLIVKRVYVIRNLSVCKIDLLVLSFLIYNSLFLSSIGSNLRKITDL